MGSKVTKEEYNNALAALHELYDLVDADNVATIPADVKDLPDAYLYFVDMPGVGSGEIKVEMEDDRVLVISGERKREEEEMYKQTEHWMGKMTRKFQLAENANTNAVSAVWEDGELTVTVEKLPEGEVGSLTLTVESPPPPVPTKLKSIEVKFA